MTTRATLAPDDVVAIMVAYRDALRSHQDVINRLNVYPVPDGDTGTNMALTVEAVVAEVGDGTDSMSGVCKAVAHGSLMGARGNSGVILSQILRGITETWAPTEEVGPAEAAKGLDHAADLAYEAVGRPIEGTILTVIRAAAVGACAGVEDGGDLLSVIESARDHAATALAATPTMLEALARAGVVDSGGTGMVLFLDAVLFVVDGRSLPEPPPVDQVTPTHFLVAQDGETGPGGRVSEGDTVGDLRYEVMYLLHAPDDTIPDFKEVWAGIGDSIVVVGGDGLWNCHIHTDDVGAAIEASLDAGRPSDIRVTDLQEEVEEERWVREGAPVGVETPLGPPPVTGVVAVVGGDGIGRIFRSLGVHHQVRGGQSMNPSTAQLLEAVEAVPTDAVIVLPNNKNIRAVAEQVDTLTAKSVIVVPTNSTVEGFAALLAYDPAAQMKENGEAMSASAQRVISAEITQAVRDTETEAGPVRIGDWIGVSREGVIAVADSPDGAALTLLDRLLNADHELVTLIEGEGATAACTRRITGWLHDEHPDIATEVHHGGQPLYPYLFGIE